MRKSNVKNPLATFMAFSTLIILGKWVRKVIKKYHFKQDI